MVILKGLLEVFVGDEQADVPQTMMSAQRTSAEELLIVQAARASSKEQLTSICLAVEVIGSEQRAQGDPKTPRSGVGG